MRWLASVSLLWLASCAPAAPASSRPSASSVAEARIADGPTGSRAVRVARDKRGTIVTAAGAQEAAAGDLPFLWPPMIDSHVHLAYWDVADQLAARGVLAAVDLSAPLGALEQLRAAPLAVRYSGPMLTSPGGYPLDGWGEDGYGIGCDSVACIDDAVAELARRGASVVKLALGGEGLAPPLVAPAVSAAHRAGLKVAVHALTDAEAALAARAGCDLLAHTPVQPLAPATIEAWRGRAVISTLAAFGGSDAAVENLRQLRAADAIVLYGTDLGNLRDAGPSEQEIGLLRAAGLDDAAITEAMTTAPARYWELGAGAGLDGPMLLLAGDPRRSVRFLTAPREVVSDVRGGGRGTTETRAPANKP
jgi:hypothetical protein